MPQIPESFFVKFSEYFPVYRKNLHLAVPVILAQIGQVTVNLADNIMVGHVGTVELAAASFAINVFHVGMLFGLGVTFGLTPLVGQTFGSASNSETGAWLKNGMIVHFLAAVLLCLLMSSVVFLLPRMGQTEEVVQMAIPYYLIQVSSLIPLLLFFSIKQFLEGVGNTKMAMIITIMANLVNIGLNYVLIYGKLGFPALGLNGAGYATLISRVLMPFVFVWMIMKKPSFKPYLKAARGAVTDMAKIKSIVSIGLPIGVQLVIEVLAFSLGAIMLGWISKESIAGHQVAIGLASMTYLISFGMASATTIRVSHAFGVRDETDLRHTIYASLHLVISFMALMGIIFVVFRNFLPMIFTSDPAVIQVASGLLIVGAFFQIFDGTQVVLLGALRGIADVKIPMYLAFFSYIVVSLPLSYLFAFVLNFGSPGVWMGFVFGLATAAVLFRLRLNHQLRKFRQQKS